MSGAQQNNIDKPLGDSKFLLHKEGLDAVILFPSLTTPGLVKWGHPMTVLIAVHESNVCNKEKQTVTPQTTIPIDVETARLFHSHLRIVPWSENEFTYIGNEPLDKEYMRHIELLKRRQNMVYYDHDNIKNVYNSGDYKGWFLGKLPESDDYLVHAYDNNQQQYPFGVLHNEVVKLYTDKKYIYLFQLQFNNFKRYHGNAEGQDNGFIRDLVWLYLDYETLEKINDMSKLNYACIKTNDKIYLQYFENIILEGNKAKDYGLLSLKESKIVSLHESEQQPGDIKGYVIPYAQEARNSEFDKRGDSICSRHPVYLASKECLDIGVVSDFHLSTRQELFPMVKAEVIPGLADYEKEKNEATEESADSSPASSEYLIGKMALNSCDATSGLMKTISSTADMVVMTGDIYDYSRNYNHIKFLEKAKERGTGVITGDIWEAMNFDKHKEKPTVYPRYMDLLSVLSLIYARYTEGKPVFYVTGNHEGYQSPYGILPRAFGFIPTDTGIPADNNLTGYEATLIFGPSAKDLDRWFNFSEEIVAPLHPLLTPWRDCLVSYGDQQNLALLGWGESEDMASPFINTFDGLPRANTACSNNQMELLKELAKRPAKANVILSHFTFLCYNGAHPLRDEGQELPAETVDELEEPPTSGVQELPAETVDEPEEVLIPGVSEEFTPGVLSNQNRGSFSHRGKRVYELLDGSRIHFTISGHAHRSGIYAFGSLPPEPEADPLFPDSRNIKARKLPVTPLVPRAGSYVSSLADAFSHFSIPPSNRPVALVCGSSGPLSRQNMDGEFHSQGIEPPQGLVLNPETREVRFVKSTHKTAKPRLAVLMEYLWFDGVRPFDTRSSSVFCLNNPPFGTRYFSFGLGEKWAELFCPQALRKRRAMQPEDLPIRKIVFHVVDKEAGEYIDQFPMTIRSITPRKHTDLVALSKTLEDFNDFRKNIKDDIYITENELYFISIHFRNTAANISDKFKISNPWCFPVTIMDNRNYICFKRKSELPDYDTFKKIKEYKVYKENDRRNIASW